MCSDDDDDDDGDLEGSCLFRVDMTDRARKLVIDDVDQG